MKNQLALLLLLGLNSTAFSQNATVSGAIKDNSERPLFGVNIIVKNSQIGTQSDEKGHFVIANLEEGAHTLSISYLGFRTRDIPFSITKKKALNLGDLILYEGNEILNEVIV